jgi:hypothetical protein
MPCGTSGAFTSRPTSTDTAVRGRCATIAQDQRTSTRSGTMLASRESPGNRQSHAHTFGERKGW